MNIKLKKAIEDYETIAVKIKELQKKQESRKTYISNYVFQNGKVEYNGVSCFPVTRVKIQYDIAAIISRFKKKVYRKFIDETIQFDTSFFVRKCAELDIDPSEFMLQGKYVEKMTLNEKKLEKLTDSGEITYKQLKDCYTAEEVKSVTVRIG